MAKRGSKTSSDPIEDKIESVEDEQIVVESKPTLAEAYDKLIKDGKKELEAIRELYKLYHLREVEALAKQVLK